MYLQLATYALITGRSFKA